MAQPSTSPHALSADFNHRVVPFPTRRRPAVLAQLPASSARRRPGSRPSQLPYKLIRQVAVLEVAGLLGAAGPDLDQAIQLALAEGPRGVVCDLTAALPGGDPVAVRALASAGRFVLDWPAIPVAVVCRDPQVRQALAAHQLGRHLIVTQTLFSALSAVLSTPTVPVQRLALVAHPTAPRAAREFVSRALLDLGLSWVIPRAVLVVSELVASSSLHAGTDIDVTLTWDRGVLRLTVGDHGPALAGQPLCDLDLHGRGLTIVGGLSRRFGFLPAADAGKLGWAVLDAPLRPSASKAVAGQRH
jgi:anti-sigma regulatory factor (Ser/Thr protein kinase)